MAGDESDTPTGDAAENWLRKILSKKQPVDNESKYAKESSDEDDPEEQVRQLCAMGDEIIALTNKLTLNEVGRSELAVEYGLNIQLSKEGAVKQILYELKSPEEQLRLRLFGKKISEITIIPPPFSTRPINIRDKEEPPTYRIIFTSVEDKPKVYSHVYDLWRGGRGARRSNMESLGDNPPKINLTRDNLLTSNDIELTDVGMMTIKGKIEAIIQPQAA